MPNFDQCGLKKYISNFGNNCQKYNTRENILFEISY